MILKQFGKGHHHCSRDFLSRQIIITFLYLLLSSFEVKQENGIDIDLTPYEDGIVMTLKKYKIKFVKRFN